MAASPSKRKRLADSEEEREGGEGGGVKLNAPLCERHVVALTSPESPPSASSQEEVKLSQMSVVVESNVFLLPEKECFEHLKGKGLSDDESCERCAAINEASQGTSDDSAFSRFAFRLQTPDAPVSTLKRWLLNINTSLEGFYVHRNVELRDLLVDGHYDSMDLRVALRFAIDQVELCHASIEGLREYLLRHPYLYRDSFDDPTPDAHDLNQLPNQEQIESMQKHNLVDWLVYLADEVDYLRRREEQMWQQVLEEKWSEALLGNVCEIEELLRLGFVTKAMVGEYCGLPGE